MTARRILFAGIFSLIGLLAASAPAEAQSDILLRLRSGSPLGDRVRVDSAGGIVAQGTLGIGLLPASGAGYRMMWVPYFAAFRAGSTDDGGAGAYWDFSNIGFFSWAGGNRNISRGYASFAMGEDVNITNTGRWALAVGSDLTVSADYCHVGGDDSRCSGTYGHAVGFHANAAGTAANAFGYFTTADANYSTAMGHRASTNGRTGAFVYGDASTTDSIEGAANNEFAVRAAGGFRFRTNSILSTGCNLPAGSGTFTCTSSKFVKENFVPVDGEDVLRRMRLVPVNTWNLIEEVGKPPRMGPFSEDFYQAFRLGNTDKAIGHQDIDGVNFAAIKALDSRTEKQDERIKQLETENAELRRRLEQIEALIERTTPSARK